MAELLLLATDPTSQMFISSKYFTLRLLDCIRFDINVILISICLTCTSNKIIVRQIMNFVLYSFGPKNVIIPSVFWGFVRVLIPQKSAYGGEKRRTPARFLSHHI